MASDPLKSAQLILTIKTILDEGDLQFKVSHSAFNSLNLYIYLEHQRIINLGDEEFE